jgi:hypothetical protein
MNDDDGIDAVGSQIVPLYTPDHLVIHSTNITQLKIE